MGEQSYVRRVRRAAIAVLALIAPSGAMAEDFSKPFMADGWTFQREAGKCSGAQAYTNNALFSVAMTRSGGTSVAFFHPRWTDFVDKQPYDLMMHLTRGDTGFAGRQVRVVALKITNGYFLLLSLPDEGFVKQFDEGGTNPFVGGPMNTVIADGVMLSRDGKPIARFDLSTFPKAIETLRKCVATLPR